MSDVQAVNGAGDAKPWWFFRFMRLSFGCLGRLVVWFAIIGAFGMRFGLAVFWGWVFLVVGSFFWRLLVGLPGSNNGRSSHV